MAFAHFAAASAMSRLSSLADNARRAVSMSAVALLLQLKARSGGHESIDQVLAKLAQVSTAPPPKPSSEPAFGRLKWMQMEPSAQLSLLKSAYALSILLSKR